MANASTTTVDFSEPIAILPLRGLVVFPLTAVPLNVGQPRSVRLIDDATSADRPIGLFASHDPKNRAPASQDIYKIGTVATVYRLLRQPDGTVRLMVNGINRVRLDSFEQSQPYFKARLEAHPEEVQDPSRIEALTHSVSDLFERLSQSVSTIPGALILSTLKSAEPLQVAYTVAHYLHPTLEKAQTFLEIDSLDEKLEWLINYISRELNILEMGQQIQSRTSSQIEKAQREHFLREQIKVIQRELGEEDDRVAEANRLKTELDTKKLPHETRKEVDRQLNRLTQLPLTSPEYSVVRQHLELVGSLPWNSGSIDNLDLTHAERVLNEDHYGLMDIKRRIIEHLAVRRLREERALEDNEQEPLHPGAILCLVGPPGVGKTSLGRSIARAMGRQFARIALGGMRDEAEIRGHRRTYIGAQPGQIIQSLRRCGTNNPVIILDEIDKLGSDFRGDPAAALLEVLDPEQNQEFRDNYLDLPFDLSRVLFVTTANTLDTIPPPLRDRMEIVQLPGYTEREKVSIARQYLVPRQVRENGLRPEELFIEEAALRNIIRFYTREAGVRNLDRQLARVCRKVATEVASLPVVDPTTRIVRSADLLSLLGPVKFHEEVAQRTQLPGVATGLAWTPVGGQLIFVEATMMSGEKSLTVTGNVGDMMRESVSAALSFVRSRAAQLGYSAEFYQTHDIHVHIPAGAIPKDGPSAGITVVTALISLVTNLPVRTGIAMTGEITLSGQVLPVGGVKQKVLAAHRAGLHTVILPNRNMNRLVDIPEEVRDDLNIIGVDYVEEALRIALTTEKESV